MFAKEQLYNCEIFAKLYHFMLNELLWWEYDGVEEMIKIMRNKEISREEKKMALYTLAEVFYGKDGLADD